MYDFEPENNSKYYTPLIEEFHIEFEYERNIEDERSRLDPKTNPTWKEEVFGKNGHIEYRELANDLSRDRIRVKYLDKSDVESLNVKDYNIILNSGFVDIWRKYDSYPMVRSIRIKNKSELKKLLQWLSIGVLDAK